MTEILTVSEIIQHNAIDVLPYNDIYWTDNTPELVDLILKTNARFVIEVGCWVGHTTHYLAKALPENGRVLAVDPWQPFFDGVSKFPISFEEAYLQFLSNMEHKGVGKKIQVLRKKSPDAANDVNEKAEVIFVDGAHDEVSVYNDLKAWLPKLTSNGVLCGDDWFIAPTQAGVKKFAQDYGFEIVVAPPKDHGEKSVGASGGNRYQQTFWHLEKKAN